MTITIHLSLSDIWFTFPSFCTLLSMNALYILYELFYLSCLYFMFATRDKLLNFYIIFLLYLYYFYSVPFRGLYSLFSVIYRKSPLLSLVSSKLILLIFDRLFNFGSFCPLFFKLRLENYGIEYSYKSYLFLIIGSETFVGPSSFLYAFFGDGIRVCTLTLLSLNFSSNFLFLY